MAVCADKYRGKYAGKYALCAGKRKKRQVDRFFFEGKKRERGKKERARERKRERDKGRKRETGTVLTRADPDIPGYNGDNKAYLDPVHVSRKRKPIQRLHPRSQPPEPKSTSLRVLYPHLRHRTNPHHI
ncbi:hypothetical protein [Scardovia wiggsiae]